MLGVCTFSSLKTKCLFHITCQLTDSECGSRRDTGAQRAYRIVGLCLASTA